MRLKNKVKKALFLLLMLLSFNANANNLEQMAFFHEAQVLLKNNQPDAALIKVNQVTAEPLKLLQSVLHAKIRYKMQQPGEALALLSAVLFPLPNLELAKRQDGYLQLFKDYLQTKILALRSLGQNFDEPLQWVYVYFANDDEMQKWLVRFDSNPKLSVPQKILRLHHMTLQKDYYLEDMGITLNEIQASSLTQNEKCEALFAWGNGKRQVQDFLNSRLGFEAVIQSPKNCGKDLVPRALYWLGAMPLIDESTQNLALQRLAKEFGTHRLADDALYKLYYLAKNTKNEKLAKEYREQLLSLPGGDMRAELAFELVADKIFKRQFKAVMHELGLVEIKTIQDESEARLGYWLARATEKQKQKKFLQKAKSFYQRLVHEAPFSFYGLLAQKRLGITSKQTLPATLNGPSPKDDVGYLKFIETLAKNSNYDSARLVLEIALHFHPEWLRTHADAMAKNFALTQNYKRGLDLASDNLNGSPGFFNEKEFAQMFDAYFPEAYPQAVQAGYRLSGLPKGAIEGIMREESLFQPQIKSRVGATGLMQLMPNTANLLRKNNPKLSFTTNLENPEHNVLLGASYLRQMQNQFSGQLPLAIMAYNAGPGHVQKWLKARGNLELDEFVEAVPFKETRDYVKRVMRSMAIYGTKYNETYFHAQNFVSMKIKK